MDRDPERAGLAEQGGGEQGSMDAEHLCGTGLAVVAESPSPRRADSEGLWASDALSREFVPDNLGEETVLLEDLGEGGPGPEDVGPNDGEGVACMLGWVSMVKSRS